MSTIAGTKQRPRQLDSGLTQRKGQILTSLRDSILDQKIKPGEYLPTEKTLVKQYDLSRHHIREVLNQLAADGLVERTPGKGTIVCDQRNPAKTYTVVVMLHVHDWLGTGIMQGLTPALREQDCRVEIIPSGHNESEFHHGIGELLASRVDGAVIMPPPWLVSQEWVVRLKRADLPLVCLDTAPAEIAVPAVATDNRLGGQLAGEHLIARGYRRLYHLTHDHAGQTVRQRMEGFLHAVAENHSQVDICLPLRFPLTDEVMHDTTHPWRAAERYWADFLKSIDPADGPLAVFAGNDNEAFGVLRATQAAGLAVGRDVGIVGFDDCEIARSCQPALTTLRQDPRRMGQLASAMLLEHLRGPDEPSRDRREYIQPELIERQSTRKANP